MERTSFVFHFEYLNDIPTECRGEWAMYIINYAETGVEPDFTNWIEKKLWNSIKNRIDTECAEYQKKMANLKQNSRKNLHSIESHLSDTEKTKSVTDNALSETENTKSDTENELSVGVYVSDSVSVSESVNVFDSVSVATGSEEPKTTQKTQTSKTKTRKRAEPMQKPTLNDVITYCQEKNYTFSPEKFWKHYESNGWRIGITPMRDWKIKADEWQINQMDYKKPPSNTEMSMNNQTSEFEEYFLNKDKADGHGESNQEFSECPSF